MTTKPPEALNPLERIREVINAEKGVCTTYVQIVEILNASDGWVCVPDKTVAFAVFVGGDGATGNMRLWTGPNAAASLPMFLEAHGLPSHTPVTPLYAKDNANEQ